MSGDPSRFINTNGGDYREVYNQGIYVEGDFYSTSTEKVLSGYPVTDRPKIVGSTFGTVTWLHLSDLHACKPRTGWDAKRVTDSLCRDLKKMQREHKLCPDLIFFTGDAAFGHISKKTGEAIAISFEL